MNRGVHFPKAPFGSVIVRVVALGLLVVCHHVPLSGQESTSSDELAQLLATLKRKADDVTLAIGQRESIVQEMASALDRAAQRSSGAELKQARWSQAIELLDGFREQNKGHPRNREFQLQAAVFRWAQGQSWGEMSELNPGDSRSSEQAKSALDDAIARLKAISPDDLENVLADNIRFRLARALSDRAEREPAQSDARRSREADALELLRQPVPEPGLSGFAGLLRADLLRRAGRLGEATVALEAAAKTDPPPPEGEALDVRLGVLSSEGKYAEALAAVRASHLGEPAKNLALVQLRLNELAALPSGADRFPIERELFQLMGDLRSRPSSETRLALAALGASAIDPSSRHEPGVWDILAEARELLGDADGAAAMEKRAAQRAVEQRKPQIAAEYRLRGAGFLFRAGKYREADALLTPVVDDQEAGGLRAKAGMLRCLARGRALAAGIPGATPAGYAEALRRQIRDFPKEPTTDEARWLLGSLTLASGESALAQSLWMEISPGAPRWIDARLAVAEVERKALESQLKIGDHAALLAGYRRASDNLAASIDQARTDDDKAALWLAQARLNAVPTVGRPQLALALLDRLNRLAISPADRYRTRLLRMIVLVEIGPPYLESEREAQSHAAWAEPSARPAFLDAIRLIDECATYSEVVLGQRRFGLILRLLLQPAVQDADEEKWNDAERAELKLRLIRAYLFLGGEASARFSLRSWNGLPRSPDDDLLGDLADTYNRLEAYELAIDVQRLRSKSLTTGSPSWFEARYGLALAYFHSGQLKDAAQLIDATAILHPNLGGGTIEKKFIKLRQRIGTNP